MDTAEIRPVRGTPGGNEFDHRDMERMGKKQELKRRFHFLSIWGYGIILAGSWEFALINFVYRYPMAALPELSI